MIFDSISSNIDQILSINVHPKDWVTYSGGTDRSGELCYDFSIQTTLLRLCTFLLRSQTVTLTVLLFWIFFFLLKLIFFSTMAFRPLKNSDHVFVSVSIDFPLNSQRGALFHCIAYGYSHADWDGVHDHLTDVPWEDICKSCICWCYWILRVGSSWNWLFIYHRKYQVKPRSSPWFSATCAASIIHRNHFFHL